MYLTQTPLIYVMVFCLVFVLVGRLVYAAVIDQKQYTDPLLPENIKLSPFASMDINKNAPIEVQEEQKKVKQGLFNHYVELVTLIKEQDESNKKVEKIVKNGGWKYDVNTNKWYYILPNGEFKKGWLNDGIDKWYFFDFFNFEMHTGYRIVDGKAYYFEEKDNGKRPKGEMYMNEVTPLGYYASATGEVIDFPIPEEYKKWK